MKPRVFVTQNTSLRIAPAEKYGEIRFLTCDEFNDNVRSEHNAGLIMDMYRHLKTFDPKRDYMLPVGSQVVTGMAFAILGCLVLDTDITVLRWDTANKCYISVRMPSLSVLAPQS